MSSSIQLSTDVLQKLDTLLARKYQLLDAIEQIKLEKAAYIKDLQRFKELYSFAKTSQEKKHILSSAKKSHVEFMEKIEILKSTNF